MAKFGAPDGISDVLAAPLGDLIAAVGRSVAEAQQAMDGQVIENFRAIYDDGVAAFEALRSIGYQPTWYQIPEATAEIAIALTATSAPEVGSPTAPRRLALYGAPVDAGYQSRFNYTVQATSSLKFRIVPVPPPAAAARLRIAPNFVGGTLAAARETARMAGIGLEVVATQQADTALVTSQQPAAGAVLPTDAVVTITGTRAAS